VSFPSGSETPVLAETGTLLVPGTKKWSSPVVKTATGKILVEGDTLIVAVYLVFEKYGSNRIIRTMG
jgi:hypothetical protein